MAEMKRLLQSLQPLVPAMPTPVDKGDFQLSRTMDFDALFICASNLLSIVKNYWNLPYKPPSRCFPQPVCCKWLELWARTFMRSRFILSRWHIVSSTVGGGIFEPWQIADLANSDCVFQTSVWCICVYDAIVWGFHDRIHQCTSNAPRRRSKTASTLASMAEDDSIGIGHSRSNSQEQHWWYCLIKH